MEKKDWTAWVNVAGSLASIAAFGYLLLHLPKRGQRSVVAGFSGLPKKGRIPASSVKYAMSRLKRQVAKCSITPVQMAEGMAVEREHADVTRRGVLKTAKIAAAHICERPDYYKRLKKYVE